MNIKSGQLYVPVYRKIGTATILRLTHKKGVSNFRCSGRLSVLLTTKLDEAATRRKPKLRCHDLCCIFVPSFSEGLIYTQS